MNSKPRLEHGIGGIEHSASGSLISVVSNLNLILCFAGQLKLPLIKLPTQLEGWVYQLILMVNSRLLSQMIYLPQTQFMIGARTFTQNSTHVNVELSSVFFIVRLITVSQIHP